ncbi:MAG: lysylphosphatidylglycerol synthase domain-containing protein [Pseudomonadota bacterium]
MKQLWRPLLGAVILVGFAIFVERYLGWAALLAPWRQLPWWEILLAAGLAVFSYWVRTLRLFDYFRAEMRGGFTVCLKLTLQHNLLNNLLPMRSGELSFPVLMSRYFSVPARRSVPALLWFRILDLHTLAIFALLALQPVSGALPYIIAGLLVWLPLPLLVFIYAQRLRVTLNKTDSGGWRRALGQLLTGLPAERAAFWRAWTWTWLNWAVKLAAFAWVLRFFIDISVPAAWMGAIAGDLTSVLPVHGIAGAGTYEAGVVAGLLPYGVTPAAALAAAVNLHLFLLGTTLAGGAASLLIRR